MPLPHSLRTFGVTVVTIVHNPGTEDEIRREAEAHIQAKSGSFAVDTPIYEGDIVEFPDPRGGVERKLAAEVDVHNPGGARKSMAHIKVTRNRAGGVGLTPGAVC
jgi:hypothetical protein